MGVVYLAWDTRLERKVAIKFLPSNIDPDSDDCERFKIEAKAAASLSHPNITTIYAIEETENEMFIVMEYIKGKELKEILQKRKLSTNETISIASQIIKGLNAAHKKSIIHRDIKSANIIVTDSGQVKIMDFGLAKLGYGFQHSEERSTLGTATYMSPEQIKGENVDNKTDIWSFGVILYEMVNRQLPFKGDYEQAVFYSILNEEPTEIKILDSDLTNHFEMVIKKCLEKDVSDRYSEGSEIIDALEAISLSNPNKHQTVLSMVQSRKLKIVIGIMVVLLVFLSGYFYLDLRNHSKTENHSDRLSSGKAKLERLAIIPFTNLKNDPDTNFLGYAMADQIIASLTYIKTISVRPSSAVRKYQKEVIDITSAGNELQVDYILTGNYLKQDDLIRLNVELININSNELLWREPFEVKYGNVFTLQDIVSGKVVDGLKLQFTKDENEMMHEDVPRNSLAYEYYLRAISFPTTIEGSRLSIEMLNKSIKLDPLYAPAFSELGFRKHQISLFDPGETEQFVQAENALLKALSLNDKLLDALGDLASMYTDKGEIDKAVELLQRSLKVNPNNANNRFFLGYAYRYAGVLNNSRKEMEMALRIDPKNNRFRSIGTTYTYMGEYEKALEAFELDSGSPFSLAWQGQVYLRMGKKEKALEYIRRALDIEPESKLGLWAKGMEGYLSGDYEMGLAVIRKSAEYGSSDSEQLYHSANIHGLLGDEAGTIALLKKSVDGGFFCYPFMLTDTFLDSVRDNPEFKILLEKAKIKHLAFKKRFF